MATRNASSRLLTQLLVASKSSPARPHPCSSLRLTTRTSPRAQATTRTLSSTRLLQKENTSPSPPSQSQTNNPTHNTPTPTNSTQSPPPTAHRQYTFTELSSLLSGPSSPPPHTLLIDVREPSELQSTGRIPTALNLPLKSSPDFAFLSAEEFEDRFGRPRPGKEDEVIFYCRSGVRSKAAAELAKRAGFGGTVSEFPGSWLEWEKQGGKVERG